MYYIYQIILYCIIFFVSIFVFFVCINFLLRWIYDTVKNRARLWHNLKLICTKSPIINGFKLIFAEFLFDIITMVNRATSKMFIFIPNAIFMVSNYIKMKFENLFVTIKKVQHNLSGANEDKESDKNETDNSNDTEQIQKDEKRLPEISRENESQKKLEIENQLLRNENQNLRKECLSIQRIKDIVQCKICMDRDKSVYFYPCGHVVMCSDCAKSIQECPICRKKIRKKQPVYLS